MAATARPLLPFDPALAGSSQLSIPLNDNALRAEAQGRAAVGFQASQPSLTSPADDDDDDDDDGKLYILSAAWGDEVVDTIALFRAGSWSYWTPYDGLIKRVGATDFYQFKTSSDNWEIYIPGGVVAVPIGIAVSDETTALTTGTAKVTFRMPYAMTLTAVRSSATEAPTGSALIVDINEGGVSILSTKLSIDASEKTSTTAASAAVISDASLADDAEITIDIDQVGSTLAGKGLKVWLIGNKT